MAREASAGILCLKGGTAEITEKKSRFIGAVCPVSTEEEALSFIRRIRKENRDARHNCYAYVTGEDGKLEKCSDDGEPSKTAGMPMLDLLKKKDIRNACIVVTRYFGGTLLGTGGLVRAYSEAAKRALENSIFSERKEGCTAVWNVDYGFYGKLQYLAEEEKLPVLETEFEGSVRMKLLLPADRAERVLTRIRNESAGKYEPAEQKKVQYCESGGIVRIL